METRTEALMEALSRTACARWIKRTNHFTFMLCLSATLILLVMLCFGSAGLKEYPALQVYQGEASFSGTSAFAYLETLVTEYPDRQIGRPNALGSAQWMVSEFEKLGIMAHLEEFVRLGVGTETVEHLVADDLSSAFQEKLRDLSPDSILDAYSGANVVAILPGQVEKRIVIGAHRDIAGSVQGAEDNGSGTATLLELARVLSGRDNYYTYVFVSFDGEEVGLTGSFDYVSRHAQDPIVIAVILDMTGFRGSDTIFLYRAVTGQGSCPLWTFALARSVMESQGLPGRFFEARYSLGSLRVFFATLFERASGEWNTDSGPFLAANIPAIGLTAAGPSEEFGGHPARAIIHSPEDTLDQVSPEALEMTGRFVERYVMSLELNRGSFGVELSSRCFTHAGSRYLSPWALWGFMLLASAAILLVPVASWKAMGQPGQEARRSGTKTAPVFFAGERIRVICVAAIALAGTCLWQVYRWEQYRSVPFRVMIVVWFSLVLGSTLFLSVWRYISRGSAAGLWRSPSGGPQGRGGDGSGGLQDGGSGGLQSSGGSANNRSQVGRYNGTQFLVDVLLVTIFLVAALVLNPFVGLVLTAAPLFVVNRINPVTGGRKVLLLAAVGLWTIAHALLSAGLLIPYAFSPGSARVFLLMFLSTASWMYVTVYSF